MTLGDVIKSRRKALGLTLLDVAKGMGVSEATVQRWESGNIKNMRYERIALLSELLQISPSELMGWGSPSEKPPAEAGDRSETFEKVEAILGALPPKEQDLWLRRLEAMIRAEQEMPEE